ncbi:hypothetical protein CR919_18600 [Stenotrophomonas sp. LMG 10879]|uniref:hypothetical protein n=1 Tax=Stenotrophomonas sp. LMG 10879 TaxID=487706 RepID=UPI000C193010|nr:hypothetical protein [Stenotrophomonas sp. LMG 10879]PII18359.1 hypothetical protein CR919_18600 [Stenotrophomonas sp. LMG 10879]
MEQTMQYLSSVGLVLCLFGTCVLAWSLTSFISRIRKALVELEKSVSALAAGNTPGAHNHLGQDVKLADALLANRNMTAAGLGLVGLGTLLQFIPYIWA